MLDAIAILALTRSEYYALAETARRSILEEEYRRTSSKDPIIEEYGRLYVQDAR